MSSDGEPIRPPQALLAVLASADVGLFLLFAWQAQVLGDFRLGWLGATLVVLFLPVIAWYRSAIYIDDDGLRREGFLSTVRVPYDGISGYGYRKVYGGTTGGTTIWLSILGQDGTRIETAISWIGPAAHAALLDALRQRAPQARQLDAVPAGTSRQTALIIISIVLIGVAMILLGAFLPPTLGEGRLFNISASLGLALGLALGMAASRLLVLRSPASFVSAAGLVLMVWLPAAAFMANFTLGRGGWQSQSLTIRSKRTFPPRNSGDKSDYAVTFEVAGATKRLSPSEKAWKTVWENLPIETPIPTCVRSGRLGYPILVLVGKDCPQSAQ